MASLHQILSFFLLLHSLLLASPSLASEDANDKLFQGINGYRGSLNRSALTRNDKAACIADELAHKLEDQTCIITIGPQAKTGPQAPEGSEPKLSSYPDVLEACKVEANSTRDGVVLQACTPDLMTNLVLGNFTQGRYGGYVNSTRYTGVGIGSEDDWIVVVLSTNTPEGRLESNEASFSAGLMSSCLAASLAGLTFLALV